MSKADLEATPQPESTTPDAKSKPSFKPTSDGNTTDDDYKKMMDDSPKRQENCFIKCFKKFFGYLFPKVKKEAI